MKASSFSPYASLEWFTQIAGVHLFQLVFDLLW